MVYLILGAIIGLFGLAWTTYTPNIAGIILFIIGLALVLKGRRDIDKHKK